MLLHTIPKILCASIICLLPFLATAQNNVVKLQSGSFVPEATPLLSEIRYSKNELVNGRYYRFIQFSHVLTEEQKQGLAAQGLVVYNYIPAYTYMASIPASFNWPKVAASGIRAVFAIENRHKLDEQLAKKIYPKWAVSNDKIALTVLHHPDVPCDEAGQLLEQAGAEIINAYPERNSHIIRIKISQLNKIAALPFIYYLEPFDAHPRPDNLKGRTDHRANMLMSEYATGLKYDGTGVNVALNDDGVIGPHLDYKGRVGSQFISFDDGDHGDHCAGTIFGAGNGDPIARGMASGASLYVYGVGIGPTDYQAFDSISSHYNKYNIRITSTSYSNGDNTGYTSLAQLMDLQTRTMPQLIHVFSAGNAGTSDFGYGAGAGWGNITGGHKQAKNVITTGNVAYNDDLSSSSSRGPAKDGRIKPDICAVGGIVYSTINPNTYGFKTGTSMACPGVAGAIAQLYQAYKTLNGGNNPNSALIKAAVLNTADDIGNPGPDFMYGWGRINAFRAYNLLKNGQYIVGSISQSGSNNHTITVPAGVAELRAMVYWHDYEATVNASVALVNDLDMKVTTPASVQVLPWVLDPTPNATTLNTPATHGADHLNNVEQVTIPNPAAGNYTVNVTGTAVPQGPQSYYLVYEFLKDNITVTYPSGGESIVPGILEYIRWEAYGNTGTFTVDYSIDNGASWINISNTVPGSQRYLDWTPPSVITGKALIRVTRGSVTDQSDAMFSIIDVPTNLSVDWVCLDSMKVSYTGVPGATGYAVSILGNKYMDSTAFSNTTSCVVKGFSTLLPGWFSVQALGPNNCKGRRAIAQPYAAVPYNCVIPLDVAITQGLKPTLSTIHDCATLPYTDTVIITIKNNSKDTQGNFLVKYTVDGGTPVTATFTGPLLPFLPATYAFTQLLTLNTAGTHTIKAWIEVPGDQSPVNDTFSWQKTIVYPPTVQLPIGEDFEAFTSCDTAANCGQQVCPLTAGWTNDINHVDDTVDWRINAGPTPTRLHSNTTGPLQDYSPGTADGQYAYIEATGCSGKQANLISPCIEVPNANPSMVFRYHMFGSTMGELHVDIFSDGAWTNDVITAITGNQGDQWNDKTVSLSAFAGKIINIRFRGITGGDESDMALDYITFHTELGIEDVSGGNISVNIFPNPSEGIYKIQVSGIYNKAQLAVTDITGKVVSEQPIVPTSGNAHTQLDLRYLPACAYLLSLQTGKDIIHRKLVKR